MFMGHVASLDGEYPESPGHQEWWLEWPEVGPPVRWRLEMDGDGEWFASGPGGRFAEKSELVERWGALMVGSIDVGVKGYFAQYLDDEQTRKYEDWLERYSEGLEPDDFGNWRRP